MKMKIIICILLLLCSISCYGQGKEKQKERDFKRNDGYKYQENVRDFRENDDLKHNRYYDEEYIGNPDLDAKIERPCRVYDLNCIRKYFAEHSKCKIRRGPLPRDLFNSQETSYVSRVNLTVTLLDIRVGGIRNTRIEEFYVNKRTNKMVFSIQIRGYSTTISSAYARFFRSGREPVVSVTEAIAIYPSVTFTAVIPNIDDLQLEKAEITAYLDALPAFYIGPELAINSSPTATQILLETFADVPTSNQEVMLTEAPFIPPAYIQYNICDFGLKVLPVD